MRRRFASQNRALTNLGSNLSLLLSKKNKNKTLRVYFYSSWRKREDSNLRMPFDITRVPGVLLQPLGHTSVYPFIITQLLLNYVEILFLVEVNTVGIFAFTIGNNAS